MDATRPSVFKALPDVPATYRPIVLVGLFGILCAFYYIATAVYLLYFHPLRDVPGPRLNAISRLPYVRHMLAGTTVHNVTKLHEQYGSAVRVSPNEVSFTSGDTAWPEIYGFRTGALKGHQTMRKDEVWYPPAVNGHPSIIVANDEAHSQGRKMLSHAFSDRALMEQEPLLQGYIDLLVNRLKEIISTTDSPQNMCEWYNWTTFDIIADLLFGEPFGSLQSLSTHKYIKLLFDSLKAAPLFYVLNYFPWLKYFGKLFVDTSLHESRKEYGEWVFAQSRKRAAMGPEARDDFMSHILRQNREKNVMPQEQINSNASLFITAGSETTATLLSGVTFLLLKNPDVHQKVVDEVRSACRSYDEITIEKVNTLSYLLAVLSEGLRYFPPVPTGFPRKVPAGGEMVSGYFMPENTAVFVSSYPTAHSEHNFKDPWDFAPERWMGDEKYAGDKRSAHQPFSFGPRNCLGKNLANSEMRLILAKIIWSFDLELDASSKNWLQDCKVFTLWRKPKLAVHVKEVVR